MNGTAHVSVGAALGVVYVSTPAHLWTSDVFNSLESFNLKLVLIVACMVGSLLPDIDHARSLISQRTRPVGWAVRLFTSHRGITHTMSACAVLSLGLMLIDYQLGTAFAIGYISHLVLDMLTPHGVPLFAPLSWHRVKLANGFVLREIKGGLQHLLSIGSCVYVLVKLLELYR